MFKLIKILNSGSNVPEPITLETDGTPIPEGTMLSMYAGKVSSYNQSNGEPQYVSLAKSKGYTVLAYPITPDMIFECEFYGDPYEVYLGDKLGVGNDDEGYAGGVTQSGSLFYFMDRNGSQKYGDKVIVRPCCLN